jgi:hypothetical protein
MWVQNYRTCLYASADGEKNLLPFMLSLWNIRMSVKMFLKRFVKLSMKSSAELFKRKFVMILSMGARKSAWNYQLKAAYWDIPCRCSVLMEEECITVEKEQCKEEVEMECNTVEKQACTSVVEQVCPIAIVPVPEYFA